MRNIDEETENMIQWGLRMTKEKNDKIMTAWKQEADLPGYLVYYIDYINDTIKIYSNHIGYLIGGNGRLFKKYEKIIKSNIGNFKIELINLNGDFI